MPKTRREIRKWSIYKITSPSGRVYIGITSNIAKRVSCYTSNVKSKQTLIYNSIRKYGWGNHSFEIIDQFSGGNKCANDKEMFFVRSYMSNVCKYPSQKGLNLTNGGDGNGGYKMSDAAKEKLRKAKTGIKQSQETIEKRREKMIGRKMNFTHITPEFRRQVSERNKGYRHTDEAKIKIAEASRGNKHRLGCKLTPEQIEHRSSMIRGTKRTESSKAASRETFIDRYGTRVLQFTLDGIFIKEHKSVVDAAKEIGIPRLGIFRNLSGQYSQSRGFIFKRKI